MTEIVLTEQELEVLRNRVRSFWLEVPQQVRLPGSIQPLTSRDIQALAWLQGCVELLAKKAGGPSVTFRLDVPDLEPDTDP